jgi:hypothetical protein
MHVTNCYSGYTFGEAVFTRVIGVAKEAFDPTDPTVMVRGAAQKVQPKVFAVQYKGDTYVFNNGLETLQRGDIICLRLPTANVPDPSSPEMVPTWSIRGRIARFMPEIGVYREGEVLSHFFTGLLCATPRLLGWDAKTNASTLQDVIQTIDTKGNNPLRDNLWGNWDKDAKEQVGLTNPIYAWTVDQCPNISTNPAAMAIAEMFAMVNEACKDLSKHGDYEKTVLALSHATVSIGRQPTHQNIREVWKKKKTYPAPPQGYERTYHARHLQLLLLTFGMQMMQLGHHADGLQGRDRVVGHCLDESVKPGEQFHIELALF